jgi:hypothetical protein
MNSTIALIMCTWKRIERFKVTLNLLEKQVDKDFVFFVVNNNIDIKNEIDAIVESHRNALTISVTHNNINRGGFGRFELAKTLADRYEIIVFIDDDQEFTSQMIGVFRQTYDPNAVKSRWAFRFGDRYYHRERILLPNINVEYCGTGGMVLPSKVFLCDELYKIPERFLFIEDLWLGYVANNYLGMKLQSIGDSDGFIHQISDGKDQSTVDRIPLKDELLQYLRKERGWKRGY